MVALHKLSLKLIPSWQHATSLLPLTSIKPVLPPDKTSKFDR